MSNFRAAVKFISNYVTTKGLGVFTCVCVCVCDGVCVCEGMRVCVGVRVGVWV